MARVPNDGRPALSAACWRPGAEEPELRFDAIEWAPVATHAPVTIDLPRYFARVHDEGTGAGLGPPG